MNPIRICHIITRLNPGGAQRNVLDLLSRMDPDRFNSSLITGRGGALDDTVNSLSHVAVYFLDDLVRPIRPTGDVRALARCISLLRGTKPHIVHTHGPKAGVIGRWAAFSAGVPIRLHTYHGLQLYAHQPQEERIATLAGERLTRWVTTHAVTLSEHDWSAAHRLGFTRLQRCTLIRNGVDLATFGNVSGSATSPSTRIRKRRQWKVRLGIDPETPLVTMIGYLRAIKAPEDFVHLARFVADIKPRTRFWLVGDGELRATVERLRDDLGLQGTLELLGNRLDIPEIWAATDVAVLTSLSEGFPRSLAEALASGLPVVATNLPGIREIVRDTVSGFLEPPHEVIGMAKRVIDLLEDPLTAAQIGSQGALAGGVLDVRITVQRYEWLYRRLWSEALSENRSSVVGSMRQQHVDGPDAFQTVVTEPRSPSQTRDPAPGKEVDPHPP
jgi:glycosyltransferase involved in cell wall biosynthesis